MKQGVTRAPSGRWTRPEDYLGAMARKRAFRRSREKRDRTEPEAPKLLLSTFPFLAMLALLAVLSVAIIVTAFPGSQPLQSAPGPVRHEAGVASKGWFQEAQKDFR